MDSNNLIKVHEGVRVNRKTIPKIRITNVRGENNDIKFLEIKFYMNHGILFAIQLFPRRNKLTIECILPNIQKVADERNIRAIEWPSNDKMFEMCSIDKFKEMANNALTDLQIYITNAPERVYDENKKQEIMQKHHIDVFTGKHCGQKKLFAIIKDKFYWRCMTREIAQFVRNCEECNKSKTH